MISFVQLCVHAVEIGVEVTKPSGHNGPWNAKPAVIAALNEVWSRIFLLDITHQVGWINTNAMMSYPQTFIEKWAEVFSHRWVAITKTRKI